MHFAVIVYSTDWGEAFFQSLGDVWSLVKLEHCLREVKVHISLVLRISWLCRLGKDYVAQRANIDSELNPTDEAHTGLHGSTLFWPLVK